METEALRQKALEVGKRLGRDALLVLTFTAARGYEIIAVATCSQTPVGRVTLGYEKNSVVPNLALACRDRVAATSPTIQPAELQRSGFPFEPSPQLPGGVDEVVGAYILDRTSTYAEVWYRIATGTNFRVDPLNEMLEN